MSKKWEQPSAALTLIVHRPAMFCLKQWNITRQAFFPIPSSYAFVLWSRAILRDSKSRPSRDTRAQYMPHEWAFGPEGV